MAKLYKHNGQEKTLYEWAKCTDIPYGVLRMRVEKYGWDMYEAINTPINHPDRKCKFKGFNKIDYKKLNEYWGSK